MVRTVFVANHATDLLAITAFAATILVHFVVGPLVMALLVTMPDVAVALVANVHSNAPQEQQGTNQDQPVKGVLAKGKLVALLFHNGAMRRLFIRCVALGSYA